MKVYTNNLKENWVVDQFITEWHKYNKEFSTSKIQNAEIVWLIAPWTWKGVKKKHLEYKKVICTIHHIDFDKFNKKEEKDFFDRDKYVDHYHAISEITKKQVQQLTNKKITVLPFWLNQNNFYQINNKDELKNKFGLDKNKYLIGSFQRDTEGHDLISPKLSKGPDRFLEIVLKKLEENKNIEVILTGNRRNYLIEKFKKHSVSYKYFKMVDLNTLNQLYNLLDLYIVSSRVEGGPRSVFECALTKTPIISTNVGYSSEILHPDSIFNMENVQDAKPNIDFAFKNVQKFLLPQGMEKFEIMFRDLYEN
jgi:glycosyltransferase involved in cell wall biosynthesis